MLRSIPAIPAKTERRWLPWDEWVRAYEHAHAVSTIDNGHGPEQRELYHMSHGDADWYIELINLKDED